MFNRRAPVDAHKKVLSWKSKILDNKRELSYRIGYLLKLKEFVNIDVLSQFFRERHIEMFILIYEEFLTIETSLKLKGGIRAFSEHFKFICQILKYLMLSIPEKIKSGFNYNAIHFVIRKFLHVQNYPKVRCLGIEICIIWLQCLQDPEDVFACSLVNYFFASIHNEVSKFIAFPPNDYFYIEPFTQVGTLDSRDSPISHTSVSVKESLFWDASIPFSPIQSNEASLIKEEDLVSAFCNRFLEFSVNHLKEFNLTEHKDLEIIFQSFISIVRERVIMPLFDCCKFTKQALFEKDDLFEDLLPQTSEMDSPSELNLARDCITHWLLRYIISASFDADPPKNVNLTHKQKPEIDIESPSFDIDKSDEWSQITSTSDSDTVIIRFVRNVLLNSPDNIAMIFFVLRKNFVVRQNEHYRNVILNLLNFWCRSHADMIFISQTITSNKIHIQKLFRVVIYITILPYFSHTVLSTVFSAQNDLKRSLKFIRIIITENSPTLSDVSWDKILNSFLLLYKHFTDLPHSQTGEKSDFSSFLLYFFQTIFVTWLRASIFGVIPIKVWNGLSELLKSQPQHSEMFIEWRFLCESITKIYCLDYFHIDLNNLPLSAQVDTRKKIQMISGKSKTNKRKSSASSFTRVLDFFGDDEKLLDCSKGKLTKSVRDKAHSPSPASKGGSIESISRSNSNQGKILSSFDSSVHEYITPFLSNSNMPTHTEREELFTIRNTTMIDQPSLPLFDEQLVTSESATASLAPTKDSIQSSEHLFSILSKDSHYSEGEDIYITWRRILGIFGLFIDNENFELQRQCFVTYCRIHEMLEDVSKNIGISKDLKYVIPLNEDQPDLHFFSQLCFNYLYKTEYNSEVYCEALKLLIKPYISPYNFNKTSPYYNLCFIDLLNKILFRKRVDEIDIFFRFAYSIFSLELPGVYYLISPVLDTAMTYSRMENIPYLLCSLPHYFVSYPNITSGDDETKLLDLYPKYLEIIVMGSTITDSSISRILYLSCIYQSIIINIEKNAELTKTLLTTLLLHLYSNSSIVLAYLSTVITSFVNLYKQIRFDICYLQSVFDYVCVSLFPIYSKCSAQNRLIRLNILMILMNFVNSAIFEMPTSENLSTLFSVLESFTLNIAAKVDLPKAPRLYVANTDDPFINKLYSHISKCHDCRNTENTKYKHNTFDEASPSSETLVAERQSSFMATIQHLANFSLLFLNNFPLPLGSENINSHLSEVDFLDSIDSNPECLVVSLHSEIIITIFEMNKVLDDPEKMATFSNPVDQYIKNRFLIIVRCPLGKFSWCCNELLREKSNTIADDLKCVVTYLSEPIFVSNDPLAEILKSANQAYPELVENYDYNINPEKFTTFSNSLYTQRLLSHLKDHKNDSYFSKPSDILLETRDENYIVKKSNIYIAPYKYRFFMRFINQLGYFSVDNRKVINLLDSSPRFMRDIKQGDNRFIRCVHKIAVFYLSYGQEDKETILRNAEVSSSFELFVKGMGWLIDSEEHAGFIGGLDRNYAKACKVYYYCSSVDQVIFHVSPYMAVLDGADGLISKLRHLGNDEVQIVWCEHYRPFRRGIINTEFGDVIIVIYPLKNGLFKINIINKPDVVDFGPLVDNCIVPFKHLPILVRDTAISASHYIRLKHNLYKTPYENRAAFLKQIADNYALKQSFEEYISSFILKQANTL